jgi:hypothetical protein
MSTEDGTWLRWGVLGWESTFWDLSGDQSIAEATKLEILDAVSVHADTTV